MSAIKRQVEEINKYKHALKNSNSMSVKSKYGKLIHHLKRELKEYCTYRGYDYSQIVHSYNI